MGGAGECGAEAGEDVHCAGFGEGVGWRWTWWDGSEETMCG